MRTLLEMRNRLLNNKAYIKWIVLSMFVVAGYTNCSQPGGISIAEKASSSAPPASSGNGPVSSYTPKVKSIEIFSASKVDILVVIDNSGSMATEQANMAARFNTFIDSLAGLDWQLAIVTTDVSGNADLKDGRLINYSGLTNTTVLTSKMDSQIVKTAFAKTIQRPETGNSNEQGIYATYRALERSLDLNDQTSAGNRELIRADAALAVIVVTDANETPSASSIKNTPSGLVSFVNSAWSGNKVMSFHSIVVKSNDKVCLAKDGNEGYGTAYESLSGLTNGIIGSVCETDYGSQLSVIGHQVQNLVNTVRLDCAPADVNGDGIADISMSNNNALTIPGYKVVGMDLVFNNPLPVGVSTVEYKCLNPAL